MIPGDTVSADTHFMSLALAEARKARSIGEVPVGAVVVRDGAVLAVGHNRSIVDRDPTAHAEVVALRAAAAAAGNHRLDGCTLYVTLEPCPMCCGAMFHARLARVVYGAADPRTGAAGSVLDLFSEPRLNHHGRVTGGVLGEACGALLQEFFRDRRRISKQRDPLREDALRTPDNAFSRIVSGDSVISAHRLEHGALAGLRMHYLDSHPDPAAAPVAEPAWLLLHGARSWSERFRAAAAILARAGHRAVAPDLIGFGRSDKPKREDFHAVIWHAHSLRALIDDLGLRRIVVVAEEGAWPVVRVLLEADPARFVGVAMLAEDDGDLPAEWHAAVPYPDRGHRAGPRAFDQFRAQAMESPGGSTGAARNRPPLLRLGPPGGSSRDEGSWLVQAMEYFRA